VTTQWIADCSTSLGIPDAYRFVIGPSDNVVPVWGTADGSDRFGVSNPLQWWRWPCQQFPALHLDVFSKPFVEDAR